MATDGSIKISTELDSKKAEKAMSRFSSYAKTAMAGVKTAIVTGSAAITAMAGYSVKVGSDFEAAMSKVSAISGATGDDLQKLTEKAKEMGAKTKFSATESAQAFEYMAMAGWKTDDMLNGIEGIMNLAAASGEDLATTSDIVTDALTAMGLQASDSGHFADVLAAASSNSNTNVGMMGETFKYVAPVAGALGYNIEDLSQAIGLMANSGIKSTQAGTALRSILTRLAKPPKEAAAAMDKYDISMKNSDGSMKSLMEVMENMRDSLRGLPKDEKAAAAAALGGQEAMSGLLAIVNASDTDFKKLASSIENADGASEKMANTMNDNLKGSITIAGSALEGFGINVYEKMEKPLKSAVDAGTEDINRLSEAFTTGGLNGVVEEAGKIFNDTCDEVDKFGPAAEGIVEPIRDIVNTGGELAKNVLPEVAEGMKFLAKNTKTAIPIVTGLVAAYKELKITKQLGDSTTTLGKAVKNSSSWWKTAQTAIGRYAEQMEAAKYTGRQYNVTLTAGQSVLGLFQRKVSLAAASTNILKAAQEGLTKAIEANPIGLAVVATTAMIAVSTAMRNKLSEQTEAEKAHSRALKDSAKEAETNLKVAQDRKQSYEDLVATQDKQAAADLIELNSLQSLSNELSTIVDSNGKVKDGEADRAAFITSQLSSALGIEINLTNGQIQNYQKLQEEIQKTIQQKKIEAVLTSQEAKYKEAVNNQMQAAQEASEAYTAKKKAENTVKKESAKLEELQKEKSDAVVQGNKALVATLDAKIQKQKEDVDNANKALKANKDAYKESSDTLAQYASDIEQYTQLAEAAASGNADAIEAAVNKITAGVKTANNATSEELQKQVVEVSKTEDLIRQEVKNKTPGFTEEMQKQASEATKAALEEFAKAAPKSADELKKVPPAAIAALIAGDMKGQLSSEAKGAVDGILDQFDGLDKKTKKKFANAVYGALEGLEGFDELKDPAKEGVDEFLESLRSALDEHSPSKKTEEIFELAMDGAANGVEAGKENVLTKAGEFVSAFLNVFASGDVGKQLENLGNKVMSYFGIGVSSKTKDSASAGKANADAANKGAGSVSPITTGQGFGTKFASGIGGLVGKARSAGKGNADAANKGAGSVNPNGTGGKFGTQYSSGVSSKTRQANSGGRSLGNNAKSGAGSVSGHDPGYNFGKGFVGGIGSWIKGAASKAAEMAKAAYKAAKHALDEHSPSKLTRKLGRWFSEGFGLGIDDEAKSAVQSAEAVAEEAVSAIDTEAIADKLKGLDLAEIMPQVYATVADQQNYMERKLTTPVASMENHRWRNNNTQTVQMSEEDIEKLAKSFARAASKEIASEMDGIKFTANQRELGRFIREAKA
jgi:TP901 family phage tail tape measure protein